MKDFKKEIEKKLSSEILELVEISRQVLRQCRKSTKPTRSLKRKKEVVTPYKVKSI